jgi:hypothetical protein
MLGSEIATAGKAARRFGSSELVERYPLGPANQEFDAGTVRNLEAPHDLHIATSQFTNLTLEVKDPIDEHGFSSLKVPGYQHSRRVLCQIDHRHPGPERLDREYEFRAQRIGEAHQVTGNIAAWHVDKVEALEQGLAEYARTAAHPSLCSISTKPPSRLDARVGDEGAPRHSSALNPRRSHSCSTASGARARSHAVPCSLADRDGAGREQEQPATLLLPAIATPGGQVPSAPNPARQLSADDDGRVLQHALDAAHRGCRVRGEPRVRRAASS